MKTEKAKKRTWHYELRDDAGRGGGRVGHPLIVWKGRALQEEGTECTKSQTTCSVEHAHATHWGKQSLSKHYYVPSVFIG